MPIGNGAIHGGMGPCQWLDTQRRVIFLPLAVNSSAAGAEAQDPVKGKG